MSRTPFPATARGRSLPNTWDIAALLCVVGALIAVSNAARGTFVPLDALDTARITLDPRHLPEYAVRTTMRMFAALLASLLFTFTYATWAAKSRRAGLILIPILDILQSVPILGFLTFTVVFFMGLFPGQRAGRRARRHLRHLHQPGLEHGVQLLPVAEDRPRRPRRGHPRLPPVQLAALLAARSAVRHARPGLEHHDVACRAAGSSSSPARRSPWATPPGSSPASAATWPSRWSRRTSARCSGRSWRCWW